jgi:hypothetical protein
MVLTATSIAVYMVCLIDCANIRSAKILTKNLKALFDLIENRDRPSMAT